MDAIPLMIRYEFWWNQGHHFLMLKMAAFLGGQGRTPHIKTRPGWFQVLTPELRHPSSCGRRGKNLRDSRERRSVVPKASLRSFPRVCSSNWENQHWNICYMCFWRWENQLHMDIYMRKSTVNSEYSLFVVLKIGQCACHVFPKEQRLAMDRQPRMVVCWTKKSGVRLKIGKDIGNCLVVWNMAFIFPYIGNDNHPSWRTHIFQRGRYTTNQGMWVRHDAWLMYWCARCSLEHGSGDVLFWRSHWPTSRFLGKCCVNLGLSKMILNDKHSGLSSP